MGGCVGAQHDSSGSLNENSDGTGGRWRQGAAAAPHCSRRRPPVPTRRPFVVRAPRRPRHALRAPRGTAGLGPARGTPSRRNTRRQDGGSRGRGGAAAPSAPDGPRRTPGPSRVGRVGWAQLSRVSDDSCPGWFQFLELGWGSLKWPWAVF